MNSFVFSRDITISADAISPPKKSRMAVTHAYPNRNSVWDGGTGAKIGRNCGIGKKAGSGFPQKNWAGWRDCPKIAGLRDCGIWKSSGIGILKNGMAGYGNPSISWTGYGMLPPHGMYFYSFYRDKLFFTGIQYKGYFCKEVWKWLVRLNLWPEIPAGIIFYLGYPRAASLFLPGWKPAGHL